MKAAGIKKFLACLGVSKTIVENDWVHCSCPLAPWRHTGGTDNNPSFGIRVVEGESWYNCWSCGGGSNLDSLLSALKMHGALEPKYNLIPAFWVLLDETSEISDEIKDFTEAEKLSPTHVTFSTGWLNSFLPALKVQKARNYLQKRGVSDSTAEFFDIRWDPIRETVAFPLYDSNQVCRGLHGRLLTPYVNAKGATVRYHSYGYGPTESLRNKDVWLGEWYLREDIPVIMVESVFDAAAVYPAYPNVIAPLSAGINLAKVMRIRHKVGDIITFFDHGMAGDKARDAIKLEFGSKVINELIPFEGGDPGEYSPEDMKTLIEGAL